MNGATGFVLATESVLWTFPALLIGSLLGLAILTYLLRTWERLTLWIAAIFTGGLAFWLLSVDLSAPLEVLPLIGRELDISLPFTRLGFTFALQPGALAMLITSLFMATAAFVVALVVSQGHSFVPFTLALLAGYFMLTLMTAGPLAPPLLAPMLLVALSSMSVFMLQAGRLTSPSGPLRTLVPPVLAFPLFLIAQWYIDQIPLNPQDQTPATIVAQLLTLGLLILLAPAPLHSALPATAQSAPPVVAAVVSLFYQLALLYLLFRLVDLYPFITAQTTYEQWFLWAGLATTAWGGIAAAGATHPGRLWGYAALHDWGLILVILANPDVAVWPLALFLFGLRAVSMLTAAAGLAVMEHHVGNLTPTQLQGAGNRLPWNSAAFLLGGLGLTGFPLSAGFTGHWTALQVIAANDWRPAAVVLLASVGAIGGFVRLTRILFGPLENRFLVREQAPSVAVALFALLLSISLAVSPQLLDSPIRSAWTAFGG